MAKLSGLAAGDVITEIIGPINSRNHFDASITPQVIVKVVGTGSVQVQETQTFDITGLPGDQNPFSKQKTPENFANVGAAINEASGQVTRTITADDTYSAIRLVVASPGDGYVTMETRWR